MHELNWGLLIVVYLFLGGLSAGLFFAAGLATYLEEDGQPAYPRIARMGALLAPWPVAIGSGILILDLGNWYRFYKLFMHFRWESPMSIGSWLLVVFTLLSLVFLWSWLEQSERDGLIARIPEALRKRIPARVMGWLQRDASAWRRSLAMVGFPLAIGVGIYTGVLLGAVQARPFWNTNLVAQLFLFSALATGTAGIILAGHLSKTPMDPKETRFLYSLGIVVLTVEFFIVIPYLIHSNLSMLAVRTAVKLIQGGAYTIPFRFFELMNLLGLALLVCLVLEMRGKQPGLLNRVFAGLNRRFLAMGAASLILVAGFLLRYIFVYAGQMSSFHKMVALH